MLLFSSENIMISFQTMLPCNQSLPLSAIMNLTGSMTHPGQVSCSSSDLLQLDLNATSSSITLAASFHCQIELHEMYTGNIYLQDGYNDEQKYLSGVSFSEE